MTLAVKTPEFRRLARPHTASGNQRRCGLEIEFSGLSEDQAAALVVERFGGTIRKEAAHQIVVEGGEIGTVQIELDTRFAKSGTTGLPDLVLDAARPVVPIEIVSEPLSPTSMNTFLTLEPALADAGAKGTGSNVLAGFGIHFNPEIVSFDDPHTARTIVAYALLEDWLRRWQPLDLSRRILPFVDPWPDAFRNAVIEAENLDLSGVMDLCRTHLSGRNYGLDLLPILKSFDSAGFDAAFGADASGARPAFHFRLPDCRIGDADWSMVDEWERWCVVEAVAADTPLFETLCADWHRVGGGTQAWSDHVNQTIGSNAQEVLQ